MDPIQIRQALREVRDLRKNILEKQRFLGYSGRARALGGCLAMACAILIQWRGLHQSPHVAFWLWGLVFALTTIINGGPLLTWLLHADNRKPANISTILEPIPVWIVGGILTLTFWRQGDYDLLFGMWMCLVGLAQLIIRRRMPRQLILVGFFYLIAGSLCLLFPHGIFARPLIMGTTFFAGEFIAGLIMHTDGNLLPFFKASSTS